MVELKGEGGGLLDVSKVVTTHVQIRLKFSVIRDD